MSDQIVLNDSAPKPNEKTFARVTEFAIKFKPLEIRQGSKLLLLYDQRSNAYYVNCHLLSDDIVAKVDTDAVLDPSMSEDYKLNRDIYTDTYAYKMMEQDATGGRSFEDIVAEYDTSYRPAQPIKVFGGQHRITAIKESQKRGISVPHGIRVYFELSKEQKLDIATVNNTSIAVPNDLLDRMQEESIGSELRDWCQRVGLLETQQNFADKRSSEGTPTVRIARSIVVNFYLAQNAKPEEVLVPVLCSSGPGLDEDYKRLRQSINWNDPSLEAMGKEFSRLHKLQRERVLNRKKDNYFEFVNKAIHPGVASGWAYVSGLLQKNKEALQSHYSLPDSVTSSGDDDPLNAKALSGARLKGVDPDTYRGLGARTSPSELGRMAEVFLLHATRASKRGINLKLAHTAIQSHEAKKANAELQKAIKRI